MAETSPITYTYVNSAETSYNEQMSIDQLATIGTLGFRSERETDDDSYGAFFLPNDSIHIDYTLSAGVKSRKCLSKLKLYQLDSNKEVVKTTTRSSIAIVSKGASDYRLSVISSDAFDVAFDSLVVSVRLVDGEGIFFSDDINDDVSESPNYVEVSSVPSVSDQNSSDWFTYIGNGSSVVSDIGIRDLSDSNQYITTVTDSFEIRFELSSGTAPDTANVIEFFQLNSSNNEITSSSVSGNSLLVNSEGSDEYTLRVNNPFSSFDGSMTRIAVAILLESGATTYASFTIASEAYTNINDVSGLADTPWYTSILDGTPVITKIGILANDDTRNLNLDESIKIRFEIDTNDEVVAAVTTANITIHEI